MEVLAECRIDNCAFMTGVGSGTVADAWTGNEFFGVCCGYCGPGRMYFVVDLLLCSFF